MATLSDTEQAIVRDRLRRPNGKPVVGSDTIATVRAIAEAVFCTENGPPEAARLDWLSAELEDFLGRSGTQSRFVYALLVWITARAAPLFIGRFRRLDRLPLDERVRALAAMERRWGEPFLAVKAILSLIYYEHPEAAREVGFDGECRLPSSELDSHTREPS